MLSNICLSAIEVDAIKFLVVYSSKYLSVVILRMHLGRPFGNEISPSLIITFPTLKFSANGNTIDIISLCITPISAIQELVSFCGLFGNKACKHRLIYLYYYNHVLIIYLREAFDVCTYMSALLTVIITIDI